MIEGRAAIRQYANQPPVPYDDPFSHLLTVRSTSVKHSVLNVKALVGAFNQEMTPSEGFLRDCEIFGNLRITFVSSFSATRHHGSVIVGPTLKFFWLSEGAEPPW